MATFCVKGSVNNYHAPCMSKALTFTNESFQEKFLFENSLMCILRQASIDLALCNTVLVRLEVKGSLWIGY